MSEQKTNIIDCYNKTAKAYADKFMDELQYKHLDRILLKAFAAENKQKGKFIDLGCGPGQTTKFLSTCGIQDLVGVDISTAMIETAKELNPAIHFETGDMFKLNYPDKTFAAAIAFYAIVHFQSNELTPVFQEINRVLAEQGEFLLSFHLGNEKVHVENLHAQQVDIDFYFFETITIVDLLKKTGFEIIDVVERNPYTEVEYASKRAYIWVKKMK